MAVVLVLGIIKEVFACFRAGAAAILAAALFVLWDPALVYDSHIASTRSISVDGIALRVAVVDTPLTRQQGLSNIPSLKPDEGMLFIFEEDGQYSFWMKDMALSIDILWITSSGRVVFIAPAVSPDTFPQAFTSDSPARYVLEVPAGFATEHGIGVGSKVAF